MLRGRGEVGAQPRLLRRARGGGDVGAVAVQHDDVPGARVEAVVTLGRVTRGGAEIAEVAGSRAARVVLVIAEHRCRTGLLPSPRRVVAVVVYRRRTAGIGGITEGEDGPRHGIENGGRRFVVAAVAAGNIAGAHQHDGRRCRDGGGRRIGGAGRAVRIGGGEDHVVGPRAGVDVTGSHGTRGAAIPEGPGVGDAVPVAVYRPTAVERHRDAGRAAVRSAGAGSGGRVRASHGDGHRIAA